MPQEQQFIFLPEQMDAVSALVVACRIFGQLNWNIIYADDEKIVGNTKNAGQQVLAQYTPGELHIRSEKSQSKYFDSAGRNRKNVQSFMNEFDRLTTGGGWQAGETEKRDYEQLCLSSAIKLGEEIAESEALSKAMNLEGSNLYLTYAIIVVNLLVFILMVFDGAGIIDPNGWVHLKWGSNYGPLTIEGEWWRLISSLFIHFGIIHILMNMYCLYSIAVYLEPLLGKIKYAVAYLATGIFGGLTSLYWHSEPMNSAGASGAIFGMYGVFLSFLISNHIPSSARKGLLQSICIFIVFNLVIGLKSGIDNSAHIGGLVSGFLIGNLYVAIIYAGKRGRSLSWLTLVIPVVTVFTMVLFIQSKKSDSMHVAKLSIQLELREGSYKDNPLFDKKYAQFSRIEEKALGAIRDTTLGNEAMKLKLATESKPYWQQAEMLVASMQNLDVSDRKKKIASGLAEYIILRKEELEAGIQMIDEEAGSREKLNLVRNKLNKVMETLQ